ncbi:hypothetical protein F2P81_019572 [Scophthalmus maximus]|uniref:Uncharacterized protein n=1 Tax=Scophthalmus maximus TaxID=52904 RepID=A0A6A4S864_SCOMX|nr:hypothetical protein F2P81_019572 [Scophthalmus maximus]
MATLYQRFTGKINTNKSFPGNRPEASRLLGQGAEGERAAAEEDGQRPPPPPQHQHQHQHQQHRRHCEDEDIIITFDTDKVPCGYRWKPSLAAPGHPGRGEKNPPKPDAVRSSQAPEWSTCSSSVDVADDGSKRIWIGDVEQRECWPMENIIRYYYTQFGRRIIDIHPREERENIRTRTSVTSGGSRR